MENKQFGAIGVVEINFFTNAMVVLDEMLKASEVRLVACEKKLGGRLVSIIVGGSTSSVNAAVETALSMGDKVGQSNIKVAVAISNPHPEIRKLLTLIQTVNKPEIQENKEIAEETGKLEQNDVSELPVQIESEKKPEIATVKNSSKRQKSKNIENK